MAGLRLQHRLDDLLWAAGLPRSTFYYQKAALAAPDPDAEPKGHIRRVYDAHRGRYGYRRITAQLRREGFQINHKAVQRLMQDMGIKSLVRPKKYRSYRLETHPASPDKLQRKFTAKRPNEAWVTDVTEFNVGGEKLYLSPIMDLYNSEIIAFQMNRRPTLDLVTKSVHEAVAKLGKADRPLIHSDQGWQYRQPTYRRILSETGLTQSMSRKGNCLDNAAMESFFGTLKSEFFYLNAFETIDQLQAALPGYIHYYNHNRIKLNLKGRSPVEYRTQAFGPDRPVQL